MADVPPIPRLGARRTVSQAYYLDSSAHIERHAGETDVREDLQELLASGGHSTSTHVHREWRHIVHASAVDIVNACDGARAVSDVRARLRHGYGRRPGHHWLALDMICGDATTVTEIEIRAEQFLRSRGDVLFELGVDVIRDGSECMLARETATRDVRTGRMQTPGHATMARIAREAMAASDKTRRKGRACWGASGLGGDISIALECANDETLLTTDRSFDEICPAIGVAHVRLDGTRTP